MKKFSIIFAFLVFSSILITIPVNGFVQQSPDPIILDLDDHKENSKIVTHHQIQFFEKVIMTTDKNSNSLSNTHKTVFSSHREIQLSEKIQITTDKITCELITPLNTIDRKAILDRLENRPFRTPFLQTPSTLKLSELQNENIEEIFTMDFLQLESVYFYVNPSNIENLFSSVKTLFAIQPNIEDNSYSSLGTSILVVFIIPITGYAFLISEKEKITFSEIKTFFSVFVIIILSSTILLTPLGISSSYWGIAYADEFSFAGIIDDYENTLTSNSTSENVTTNTVEKSVNATDLGVNATDLDQIIIPDSELSLQFDGTDTVTDTNSTENATLELKGQNDYIQIDNATSTNELSELTISTWIKPDYSQGSSEFTILSKENLFVLSVNNNILPEKIVKFSIFDGIKWTTVESYETIPEKWTHIAATFDSETISIYVNGVRQNTSEVSGIPTLSINGKLETTTLDTISSKEDIVIGAYISTVTGIDDPKHQFSGEIDNVELFDSKLDDLQISIIYDENSQYYDSLNTTEPDLDAILAEIEAQQNNGTLTDTNSQLPAKPELAVSPIITANKTTFEISDDATFELEFYEEHDALLNELYELESATDILLAETNSSIINLEESDTPILGFLFGLLIPNAEATATSDILSQLNLAKAELERIKSEIESIKQSGQLEEHSIKQLKHDFKKAQ